MKRLLCGVVGIVVLGSTLIGSQPATEAAAVGPCTIAFEPGVVPVGTQPVVVAFKVHGQEYPACRTYEDDWELHIPRWDIDATTRFAQVAIDANQLANADAEPVSADLRFFTKDGGRPDYQVILVSSFRLVHATTWGTTFTAKRVDSGHVKVAGTLTGADWEKLRYLPYGGRTVTIELTPPDHGPSTVARPKLDAKGHFDVTIASRTRGLFQAGYRGDATSSGAVSPVVTVR